MSQRVKTVRARERERVWRTEHLANVQNWLPGIGHSAPPGPAGTVIFRVDTLMPLEDPQKGAFWMGFLTQAPYVTVPTQLMTGAEPGGVEGCSSRLGQLSVTERGHSAGTKMLQDISQPGDPAETTG